jgi:hypothetical protein
LSLEAKINPDFLIKILSSDIKTNGPLFSPSVSLSSTVSHNGHDWSWFESLSLPTAIILTLIWTSFTNNYSHNPSKW